MLYSWADGIAMNTSAGPQIITGLSFTPKIVFIQCVSWQNMPAPSFYNGYWGARHNFGVVDDSLNQYCIFHTQRWEPYTKGTAPASENIHSLMDNSNVIHGTQEPPSILDDMVANVSSIDPNGFTLNITTPPPFGYRLGYMALGGDSITNTKVGSFLSGGLGSQSVTGIGFQPTLIMLFSQMLPSDNTSQDSYYNHAFGMANDVSQFAFGASVQKLSTTSTHAVTSADNGYVFLGCRDIDTHSAPSAKAQLTSMDVDGFTLNWTVHDGAPFAVGYIAIKGDFHSEIGSYDTPAPLSNFFIQTQQKATTLFFCCPNILTLNHAGWENDIASVSYGFRDNSSQISNFYPVNYSNGSNGGTYSIAPTQTGRASRYQIYRMLLSGQLEVNTPINPAQNFSVPSCYLQNSASPQNARGDRIRLDHHMSGGQAGYSGYLFLSSKSNVGGFVL